MEREEKLSGKKLLILGGADLHGELVRAARRLGVETWVTDYLPLDRAPAKRLADHAWDLNVTECDAIVERCRQEGIDGVLNMYYDPCQRPYQEICEKLGLPCFGTREQYEIFTNKKRFLETCAAYGFDLIPQYREEDFAFDNPAVEYPVYVKPSDSRGTRGQSVCRSYAEVGPAIELARSVSTDGAVVIERFMENARDSTMSFFMIDGELYPSLLGESYPGVMEDGTPVTVIGLSPTKREDRLRETAFPKIRRMLRELGLRNAPVFIQGFLDGDVLRPYDPALRLPGILFEQSLRAATGLDVFEAMIVFALTGAFPEKLRELETCHKLNGMYSATMWIYLRPGTIREIRGVDRLGEGIRLTVKHRAGDRIEAGHDIRQCFAEIDFLFHSTEEAERTVQKIYRTLQILDDNGEDMKTALLDTARLWD